MLARLGVDRLAGVQDVLGHGRGENCPDEQDAPNNRKTTSSLS